MDPDDSKGRILVVDDDQDLLEALCTVLSTHGFAVVGAPSGEAALAYFTDAGPPDVLLLDLMMPNMTGWELRRRIAVERRWADVQVVVITAMRDRDLEARPIAADLVLHKPLELDTLLAAVGSALSRGEARPRRTD